MVVELWQGSVPATPSGAQLTYRGGPLLTSVKLFGVFFDDFSLKAEMSAFLDWLATSDVLGELSEYGTGLGSHIGDAILSLSGSTPPPPPPNGGCPPGCVPCTASHMVAPSRASYTLQLLKEKNTPSTVTDAQLQHLLAQYIGAGSLPKPDSETVFVLFLPDGVSVTLGQDSSCTTFCGYHDYFMLSDGTTVYYAVLPFPSCAGCLGPFTTLDALTSTTSHEVCEAVTDPIPGTGWYDDQNGEIGDICAWQTRQDGGYNVQLEWSNKANSCI